MKLQRPPGPRGRWLLGNTIEYDADRIAFIDRCHREYGDVFSFDSDTIVVGDPELIHQMLGRTNTDFFMQRVALAAREDPEQATAASRVWVDVKRTGFRGMNRAAAHAHAARLHRMYAQTLGAVGEAEFDVFEVAQDFKAIAAADYCLGDDAEGMPDILRNNATTIEPLAGASSLFPAWLPIPSVRRFVKARQKTLDTVLAKVRARAAAGWTGEPRDLLDMLLAVDPPIAERHVQGLLRAVMLSAYGVPAAAMTWIVHILATHPDIQKQAAAEADWQNGVDLPRPDHLPYIEAVVKEALRLWPPTWLLARVARHATGIGDWRLRTGDHVMASLYHLHRNPRWWSDPDTADPRRWLDGEPPVRHTHFPFGAGPRVCVGTQVGMVQLILATYWLARDFEISVQPGREGVPNFDGLLVPKGFRASFRRRG